MNTDVAALVASAHKIRFARNQISDVSNAELHRRADDEFYFNNSLGEDVVVTPTFHAVERFKWRYWIYTKTFVYETDADVLRTMRYVFNRCHRDTACIERNSKYRDCKTASLYRSQNYCFVVDTTLKTIVTFELSGQYGLFNAPKFEQLVKQEMFDHKNIIVRGSNLPHLYDKHAKVDQTRPNRSKRPQLLSANGMIERGYDGV